MCRVGFGIGPASRAIEHIIGGKMNKTGVQLTAGERQIAHGQGVDLEGGQRFLFGHIHLVVSCGIEHQLRIPRCENRLDLSVIRDVELFAIPTDGFVTAFTQFANQFNAELTTAADNCCFSSHRNYEDNIRAISVKLIRMPAGLVAQLEEWKKRYGTSDLSPLHALLEEAAREESRDAHELIRLHECLLFLRAYPADRTVKRLADAALAATAARAAACTDQAAFEDAEASGIAGTAFSAVFSYEVAARLCARYPGDIDIDWENYATMDRLGPVVCRILPLAREDWPVEAHVSFRRWIERSRGPRETALEWLLRGIGQLKMEARLQAELYDSLELLLLWKVGRNPSRTFCRVSTPKTFYYRRPLLRRRDIDLEEELSGPPLPVRRLSANESRRMLDVIVETSASRYRELYGFSHPDRSGVFTADAGRGVEIVFFGVPPEWRLPLRAYHAGMFFVNGVPAGYVEVLSFFERAEVGFNLYYTFREGEAAWLYARLLRLFRQVLGVRAFSVDPYQIGNENDEAIDSGAFWFYRKLGFRPLAGDAAQLTAREEQRMERNATHRSSRATLERLGESYMIYECGDADHRAWDRFRIRTLAQRGLGLRELGASRKILAAKQGASEAEYLRLMQQDAKFRARCIGEGSVEEAS